MRAATREGYTRDLVAVVAEGHANQLRRMPPEIAAAGLSNFLHRVAQAFGARKEVPADVLEACIDLVLDQFGQLGPAEIYAAYQLWASGKIPGMEMWGGELSATQLGRVLAGYIEYRRKALATYLAEVDRHRTLEKGRRMTEELNQAFREQLPGLIDEYRKSGKDWRDIPSHWYGPVIELGFMERPTPEEAKEIQAEATRLARADYLEEVEQEDNIFTRRALMASIESTVRSRRNTIGYKLAMWRKIFNNGNPGDPNPDPCGR